VADATALRLATFLLALDGLAALHLAGLVGTGGALGVALIGTLAWRNEPLRDRLGAVPGLGRGVVVLAAAASALDLLYVAASVLDGFARLLVFLLLYRLVMRRVPRDLRDVAFLAFFMLVAAAPLTFGVGYLFVFLSFLVLGTWMLMLYHVATEAERTSGGLDGARAGTLGRDLLGLSLGASAATLAITAALFFVIPRVGQAALTLRGNVSRMISGFSDRVELGSFGEIETDATVVMRVQIPEESATDPERLPGLRWRGLALDRYDGRAWTSSRREHATTRRSSIGQFELAAFRGTGPIVVQEIYLEPFGADAIFAAPRVLSLGLRAASIVVDDMDGVSVPAAAARFRYVVHSELETGARGRLRPLADEARARYLQLPPLPARVGDLAREVAAGTRGPGEAARALTAHLAGGYRYSRALRRTTALDPVDEFLFVQRSGNCEYFAAALAVMLRSLDVPARVINGFQRGEWNPYGRYFMVRLLDAHSWVEAYVDGDWITLDPSPRAGTEPAGAPAEVALYLDALRVRWYRYVVNWSLQDQVLAALRIREATLAWKPRIPALADWQALPREIHLLLLLVALTAALLVWRRRPGAAAGAAAPLPPFYARALRVLARRGLAPGPGETAREFAARVRAVAPTCAEPFGNLTAAYERLRFGARPPAPPEQSTLDESVLKLRSHMASLSGHLR
jgi:transglutaminase-like putative cysteine protease